MFTIGKWNIFQIFYILNIHNNVFIKSLNFTEQGRRQVLACMSSLVRTDAKEMLYEFIVFTSGVSTAQVDIERLDCHYYRSLEEREGAEVVEWRRSWSWSTHLVKPIRLPDPMPAVDGDIW